MDRLEFLVRRFRQIAPQPLSAWDPVRARRLQCWLKDDVLPVLDDYIKRPRFRAQAAWPLQTLRPVAGTAERALVEKIDFALVAHARALRQFAKRPPIRKRLEAVVSETRVTEEDVLVGVGGPKVIRQVRGPSDRLAVFLLQLDQIAGRFWKDLVCLDDYFEPIGGWLAVRMLARHAGEFIVTINPELHPGGDFVSRSLVRRVEVILEVLRDFHRFGDKTFRLPKGSTPKPWNELNQGHRELTRLAEQLRQACLEGDQQPLRDGCILLTQAYAALHPSADVGWLGLHEAIVQRGISVMGHRLQSCHGELLERLAVSLGELQKLYADCIASITSPQ